MGPARPSRALMRFLRASRPAFSGSALGVGEPITDPSVRETLGLTDRAYIIYSGHVLTEGTPAEIVANPDVRRIYLAEDFKM